MTEIHVLLSGRAAQALGEVRGATGHEASYAVMMALRDELMIRSGGLCKNEFQVIKRDGTLGRHLYFPLAEQARGKIRGRMHAVVAEPQAGDPGVVALKLNLDDDYASALTKGSIAAGYSQAQVINQAILDERVIVGLALHNEGLFEGKGRNGRWFPSVLYHDAGGKGTAGKLVAASAEREVA